MKTEIKIGDRFMKPINGGKMIECEVIDIVQRVSTKTGKVFDIEYWAKSGQTAAGLQFHVARSTILRGIIT